MESQLTFYYAKIKLSSKMHRYYKMTTQWIVTEQAVLAEDPVSDAPEPTITVCHGYCMTLSQSWYYVSYISLYQICIPNTYKMEKKRFLAPSPSYTKC
jgi:hypothetical protein